MEKLTFTAHEQDTIVLAGGIITGFADPVPGPGALLVSQGRIKEIIRLPPSPDLPSLFPSRKILDYSSLTLLPPLVDCHVHLAFDGIDFQASVEEWNDPDRLGSRLDQELAACVRQGILAVRDGGDRGQVGWLARRKASLPLVLSPGVAIFRQGRYGSFLGRGIADPEEGQELIRELHRQGVDLIKILVSGIVSFREYGKVGPLQFTAGELALLVNTAHDLGLRVMAHASSDEAVQTAIAAEVDSVEHGYFLSTWSLEAMAAKGIAWVPTVIPVAGQLTYRGPKTYTPQEQEVISRTCRSQLAKIWEAGLLGVTLGIGTDAGAYGVRHGLAYRQELALFREAGLSTGDILRAATAGGPKILGLEERLGILAPGKDAHFIGVEGNPLADLSALNKLKLICTCSN